MTEASVCRRRWDPRARTSPPNNLSRRLSSNTAESQQYSFTSRQVQHTSSVHVFMKWLIKCSTFLTVVFVSFFQITCGYAGFCSFVCLIPEVPLEHPYLLNVVRCFSSIHGWCQAISWVHLKSLFVKCAHRWKADDITLPLGQNRLCVLYLSLRIRYACQSFLSREQRREKSPLIAESLMMKQKLMLLKWIFSF